MEIKDFYTATTYAGTITIDNQEYNFEYDVENGYLNGCNGIEVVNDDDGYEEASDEITDIIGDLVVERLKDDETFKLQSHLDNLEARLNYIKDIAFTISEEPDVDVNSSLEMLLDVVDTATNLAYGFSPKKIYKEKV